jgi:plastocyanin
MKKIILSAISFLALAVANATIYTIGISGLAYTPTSVTACVGDTVRIAASGNHPCTEVSQATWTANGSTPISGAMFTSQTTQVTIVITAAMANIIYFVCDFHVGSTAMKGQIQKCSSPIFETQLPGYKFGVLPNPVQNEGYVFINAPGNEKASIVLADINGKIVKQIADNYSVRAGEQKIPFSAADLTPGTYIMILRTSKGMTRKQFLVSR